MSKTVPSVVDVLFFLTVFRLAKVATGSLVFAVIATVVAGLYGLYNYIRGASL